jgi:hypothetical protein
VRNLSTLNWEGRIQLPTGEQKWINLRSSPRLSECGKVVWEGVMWNITHSKHVEADLRESRSQLAALSNHLQRIKEEERERIARDVHDVLGGTLVAMKFEMSLLESKLDSQLAQARERARNVGRMVDDAISHRRQRDARAAARHPQGLRPGRRDRMPGRRLLPAHRHLGCTHFASSTISTRTTIDLAGLVPHLPGSPDQRRQARPRHLGQHRDAH